MSGILHSAFCILHWYHKLTPRQLQRLKQLVLAGPEAAGYATGCWNAALIQDLIRREFDQLYHLRYVSVLVRNLGFSYQKARFVSDHLDEVARKRWRVREWPAIVRKARRSEALLVVADEASFAQWGPLGYTWAVRGEQPVVKTTGKRKGYKVLGMVDYFSRFRIAGISLCFPRPSNNRLQRDAAGASPDLGAL